MKRHSGCAYESSAAGSRNATRTASVCRCDTSTRTSAATAASASMASNSRLSSATACRSGCADGVAHGSSSGIGIVSRKWESGTAMRLPVGSTIVRKLPGSTPAFSSRVHAAA